MSEMTHLPPLFKALEAHGSAGELWLPQSSPAQPLVLPVTSLLGHITAVSINHNYSLVIKSPGWICYGVAGSLE